MYSKQGISIAASCSNAALTYSHAESSAVAPSRTTIRRRPIRIAARGLAKPSVTQSWPGTKNVAIVVSADRGLALEADRMVVRANDEAVRSHAMLGIIGRDYVGAALRE